MKISIFGVGYVGAVTAACLARDGHEVTAVDVSSEKVSALMAGIPPIVEPGLDDILAQAVRSGRLTATCQVETAVRQTELSLICVGSPSQPNGSLDTKYVARVSEQIGHQLARKSEHHTVVLRSTVLPGTTEDIVAPLLQATSGKSLGAGLKVGYFPEFLREGSAINDFDNPGAIIFGAPDSAIAELLLSLHKRLHVAPRVLPIRCAEAVKYVNNAWHATKISFSNEIGRICKALSVDSYEVMDAVCSDTKLNISAAYMRPGFAFGGSCLPKDLRALRHRSRLADVETPMLDAVLETNENQIRHAFSLVAASGSRNVGLVGLSFKAQTDDLRESPLVDLAERLLGKGFSVHVYDPIVRLSRLTGANKSFLCERLPHIRSILLEDADELVRCSDTLVLGNSYAAEDVLTKRGASEKVIVDLVRTRLDCEVGEKYNGICW